MLRKLLNSSCNKNTRRRFARLSTTPAIVEMLELRQLLSGTTIFVSPTGTDTADGASLANATSITHAKTLASAYMNNTTTPPTGDCTVQFGDGTYSLSAPITFGASDSGTNGYRVIYQAAAGANPVISGGKSVPSTNTWTQTTSPAGATVFVTTLDSSFNGIVPREIYVNGQRATRTITPATALTGWFKNATGYHVDNANVQSFTNPDGMEFVYTSGASTVIGFWEHRVGVTSIVADGTGGSQITMDNAAWTLANSSGFYTTNSSGVITADYRLTIPTSIENCFQFLDTPGQYYLNSSTNQLYYCPRAGEVATSLSVVIPTINQLFVTTGTTGTSRLQNVSFQGLTFSYTGAGQITGYDGLLDAYSNTIYGGVGVLPAAVNFDYASNVRFVGDTFQHLGTTGLLLGKAPQSNLISSSVLTDISAGGIQIDTSGASGTTTDTNEQTLNNSILDNTVSFIGAEYRSSSAIQVNYSNGTIISHNEVSNVPYSGIALGGGGALVGTAYSGNNHIVGNLVHDTMQLLSDGAPIYTAGAQGTGGYSEIANNYLYHNKRPAVQGGIYTDYYTQYFTIHDNVIRDANYWTFQWGHKDDTTGLFTIRNIDVYNNFSDTTSKDTSADPSPWPASQGTESITYTNNVENITLDGPDAALAIQAAAGPEKAVTDALARLRQPLSISATAYNSNGTNTTSNVLDNNPATYWESSPGSTINFLQLDLGQSIRLGQITLVAPSSANISANERTNFSVVAGNDPTFTTGTYVYAGSMSTALAAGATWTFDASPLTGTYRYLRFGHLDTSSFAIGDISVTRLIATSSTQNSGNGGNQGSYYTGLLQPGYAVDGNSGTTWAIATGDNQAWVQIDLGYSRQLSSVSVLNDSTLDYPNARRNYELLGSNDANFTAGSSTLLGTFGATPQAMSTPWVVDLSGMVLPAFRYLRVQRNDGAAGTEGFHVTEIGVNTGPGYRPSSVVPSVQSAAGVAAPSGDLLSSRPQGMTASSYYSSNYTPDKVTFDNPYYGWVSNPSDPSPWIQADLGSATRLGTVSVTTRRAPVPYRPDTQRNFKVLASNDPTFAAGSTWVLGTVGSTPLPYESILTLNVPSSVPAFRYVRIAKTDVVQEFSISRMWVTSGDASYVTQALGSQTAPVGELVSLQQAAHPIIASSSFPGRPDLLPSSIADGSAATAWLADSSDTAGWVRADLGSPTQLGTVTLVGWSSLNSGNQYLQNNFQLQGSNDPTFAAGTYTVLGQEGTLPLNSTWTATFTTQTPPVRYLRLAKTDGSWAGFGELWVTSIQSLQAPTVSIQPLSGRTAPSGELLSAARAAVLRTASTNSTTTNLSRVTDNVTTAAWVSATTTGVYLQLDLATRIKLGKIDLVTRQDATSDSTTLQNTRKNIELRASNDPNFSAGSYVVLGSVGATALGFKSTWSVDASSVAGMYRYVRYVKTGTGGLSVAEVNVARNWVWASSVSGTSNDASKVADNNTATGWSSATTDTNAGITADLGTPTKLKNIEVVTRQDVDQAATRNNVQLLLSNDPSFAPGSYVAIDSLGNLSIPYRATWKIEVPALFSAYRYIRLAKTDGGSLFVADLWVTAQATNTQLFSTAALRVAPTGSSATPVSSTTSDASRAMTLGTTLPVVTATTTRSPSISTTTPTTPTTTQGSAVAATVARRRGIKPALLQLVNRLTNLWTET